MPLAAGNPRNRSRQRGFSLLEVIVSTLFVSVVLFTVTQTMMLILLRSLNAIEVARREDQGARFVSSITLAAKTAASLGIYSDLDSYMSGPQTNLAPEGNVLVCDSPTQQGTSILYVFLYDPVSRSLKRFENNSNTERMTLINVVPTGGSIFNQKLGLVQGHWQMPGGNQLLTFAAYGTPLHMR
jgi:type II secretory pathway component PulJ